MQMQSSQSKLLGTQGFVGSQLVPSGRTPYLERDSAVFKQSVG